MLLITTLLLCFGARELFASNITDAVFANVRDGMPAAFGDFNSDDLTDVFVLRNNSNTVDIFLASDHEPLLSPGKGLSCTYPGLHLSSVVPGDFDGDAFMDILITTAKEGSNATDVYIIWGGVDHLNCSDGTKPFVQMVGEPLAIDYNQDMIIDLFGLNNNSQRTFWIFNKNRTAPTPVAMDPHSTAILRRPHSHAFLDINEDYTADLVLTTDLGFEVWYGDEHEKGFLYNRTISPPLGTLSGHVGQSLFLDVELTGKVDLILPMCFDDNCRNSTILVNKQGNWHDLQVNFKDDSNVIWGFHRPDGQRYTNTITLRGGDFNMDGFPDLLATLTVPLSGRPQVFLLENVPCSGPLCKSFSRTYAVRWDALKPFSAGTVMGVFYDFYQDGILDVILVQKALDGGEYEAGAFRNSLDYDANFMKVMVLTGLSNARGPDVLTALGKRKRTYGTNLPGPRITYYTVTQEGQQRTGVSAQLPQSAHFSLNLPYSIFGLGRTPNFVDTLSVGLSNRSRSWTQIIPNSQMVVIPWPPGEPSKWRAQLFVTPSKLILMSVAALTGTCGLITLIIAFLYLKERREDKIERLQESHRFHFDAM